MRRTRRFLKTGSGIWTPAQLSNQVGWWRASDITGKVDGDSVTAWPDSFGLTSDLSGSGVYKTGANGIGGKPAILMNGGTTFIGSSVGTFADFTLIQIMKPLVGTQINTCALLATSPYVTFGVNLYGATNVFAYILSSNDCNAAVATNGVDTYFMAERSGTAGWIEANTVTDTATLNGATFTATPRIPASNHLTAELIVLNGVMTSEEKASLRAYITATYGIATS